MGENLDTTHDFFRGVVTLPKSFILESRNQGTTDVCFAFVAVSCMFAEICLNPSVKEKIKASEQQFLDCLHNHYPPQNMIERKPGTGYPNSFPRAFRYAKNMGLFPSAVYPWHGIRKDCTADSVSTDHLIRITNYVKITNAAQVVKKLNDFHAVTACIDFTSRMENWDPKEIYIPNEADAAEIKAHEKKGLSLKHAITLVGYGKEEEIEFFLAQNSYGVHWGHLGFFKVVRGCVDRFYHVEGVHLKPVEPKRASVSVSG